MAEQFKPSPLVAVFEATYGELRKQAPLPLRMPAVQRAAQIASSEELTHLESRLPWLATTGAVTPFIGLFGTVWGIIDAFHGLGPQERRHFARSRLASPKRLSLPLPACSPRFPQLSPTTCSCSTSANSARAWTTSAWN